MESIKNLVNINRDNAPKFGDVLVPKRGRHLDPVIVIHLHPGDKQAVVKDQRLVENDPKWTKGNKVIDCHPDTGAVRKTYRQLAKDYRIDADVRKANDAKIKKSMEARGWRIPDSWFPDLKN